MKSYCPTITGITDRKKDEIPIKTMHKYDNFYVMDHLDRLEAEAIHIFREVSANFKKPVLLYSIGKDSSVLLHLARKAFFPAPLPFPLLHIDTGWKFREMISFRDNIARTYDLDLLVHTNPEGVSQNINPFEHGAHYTHIMKTVALRQAIDHYMFDAAIGGARRDEEKSRAKERIFSFRSAEHAWEPRTQRPELWKIYNTRIQPRQSARIFPLSNWTEQDIWQYILREKIDVVPLYFAKDRPVVYRDGLMIMQDDSRIPLAPHEKPDIKSVRYRTLGCYPLTAAMESHAATVQDILDEMQTSKLSERHGRVIDKDGNASMEQKKREGYF